LTGKWTSPCGFMADVGVGGGASDVLSFAWVLRVVEESIVMTSGGLPFPPPSADDGGRELVWRDSFGRFGVGGLVDGITESIAPATFFRSSAVCGDSSRWVRRAGGKASSSTRYEG